MSSLGLHIGLGASRVLAGHVGGIENRWEFFITGEACEEMNRAEKDASNMDIVLSKAVGDWIRSFKGVRKVKHASLGLSVEGGLRWGLGGSGATGDIGDGRKCSVLAKGYGAFLRRTWAMG